MFHSVLINNCSYLLSYYSYYEMSYTQLMILEQKGYHLT